jgi:single-strand DNA-binding protein
MNTATFAGRLGRDPETRSVGDKTVTNFSLAVDRFKKDDGPLWVDVSAWGKLGENVQRYITKGREVVVTGRVDLRVYTKNDGTQGASLTLDARDVTFVGGKGDGEGFAPRADSPVSQADFAPAAVPAGDNIPFLREELPEWVAVKGTERS